jgi:hypothetical protein
LLVFFCCKKTLLRVFIYFFKLEHELLDIKRKLKFSSTHWYITFRLVQDFLFLKVRKFKRQKSSSSFLTLCIIVFKLKKTDKIRYNWPKIVFTLSNLPHTLKHFNSHQHITLKTPKTLKFYKKIPKNTCNLLQSTRKVNSFALVLPAFVHAIEEEEEKAGLTNKPHSQLARRE